mgnify:CR=1 FL=1
MRHWRMIRFPTRVTEYEIRDPRHHGCILAFHVSNLVGDCSEILRPLNKGFMTCCRRCV